MNTFNVPTQRLNDSTIDIAMEDPAIEAIFANANPEDYLDQILRLCVRRGIAIHTAREELINNSEGEEDMIKHLLCYQKLKKAAKPWITLTDMR